MSDDPALAKNYLLGGYVEEYDALTALFADLPDDAWHRPSALPGWDVQAIAAHIMGTEYFLLGEQPTVTELESRPHVHNEIAARNEQWVETLKGESPAALRTRWADVVRRRTAVMSEMTDEQWHAPSWSPVGDSTLSRFMRIRVFDCWLHEQDIRDAVDLPGHTSGTAVDIALDEMSTALGYVVGRRAGAPDGSSVTFELTDVGRQLHVVVDGRAAVVDDLDDPTVTLRMTAGTFARLAGGRGEATPHIEDVHIDGDRELGQRIAENLAFTI